MNLLFAVAKDEPSRNTKKVKINLYFGFCDL